MPRSTTFRVFVSAVTNELASYRHDVARVLRRKELDVRDQEHFRQGGATLIEALRDYIRDCDAVVFLIGDQCGSLVGEEHASVLGANSWFDRFRQATELPQASYTQWESFLAKESGKKTYTFFTSDGFQADKPSRDTLEQQDCQRKYREWIEQTGEHRDALTTREKLVEDVLVLPFPDLGRPKPVLLPYRTLGKLFKGRDEFLEQLRQSLQHSGDGHATAIVGKAVHGLGGVGKTRLAVEYAWQHLDDYSALLFVTADSPEALRRNLAALCGPLVLDLPEQHVPEEEPRLAAAVRWLREHPGWFLILDNLDSKEAAAAAEQILAQLLGGHVLITSRLSNWSGQVTPLELDVLTEDDARDFLLARTAERRRKTPQDAAQARALAVELGQLALALEQAAAYIAQRRLTFADYLNEWRVNHAKVIEWFDERLMQYPRSVAVTWQTSFDKLSESARRLLHRLAWFAPDPIPESLLDVAVPLDRRMGTPARPDLKPFDDRQAEETGRSAHPTDPREALADLETYSLVTRSAESPTFTVHRLVQDVTRRSLRDDPEHHALTESLYWINAAFKGDPQDVRTWPTLDPLAPHARAAANHADQAAIAEPTAQLMNDLAQLLDAKALYAEAEPLMRRALAIDEQSYGAEHPDVARDLNNLAGMLKETNRLAEAEPLMRRALAIDEQSYGAEHPDVATNLNNLAQLLQATNRLAEAEPLMRRALAIDEQSYGAEHPSVAVKLITLAHLLSATNRLAEAEPLMRRALAIDEQSYGVEHPRVAIDLNNLAQSLQDTNRLTEAEPLMRRALAIDEQSFGDRHPKVAIRLNNLAALLQATNRLAEAEPLMRRALAIIFTSLGGEHPSKLTVRKNYRILLAAMKFNDDEIAEHIRKATS